MICAGKGERALGQFEARIELIGLESVNGIS